MQPFHLMNLRHVLEQPGASILRKVVSVTYPGTREVRRRVSIDIDLQAAGPLPVVGRTRGTDLVAFPVGMAARGRNLVGFSLYVDGQAASLCQRVENERLTEGALCSAYARLEDAEGLRDAVRLLVTANTAAEGREYVTALASTYSAELHQALADTDAFRRHAHLLTRLGTNFVMYARVPVDACRLILVESTLPNLKPRPSPIESRRRHRERLLLEWTLISMRLPEVAEAGSAHLEVTLPDGLAPADERSANADPGLPGLVIRTFEGGGRFRRGDAYGQRIHVASPSSDEIAVQGQAYYRVRLRKYGWLTAVAVLTLAAGVVSGVGAFDAYVAAGQVVPAADGGIATPVISMVLTLGAALVARPDDHDIVDRTRGIYRLYVVGLGLLVLLGATVSSVSSALAARPLWVGVRWTVWFVSTGCAVLFLLFQACGWWSRDRSARSDAVPTPH